VVVDLYKPRALAPERPLLVEAARLDQVDMVVKVVVIQAFLMAQHLKPMRF